MYPYPSFIWFDGGMNVSYSTESLTKIALMSADLKQYTSWNGEGDMPEAQLAIIKSLIDKMHALLKPVRFWGAPDNMKAWQTLIQLQADYINTDRIDALAGFLK